MEQSQRSITPSAIAWLRRRLDEPTGRPIGTPPIRQPENVPCGASSGGVAKTPLFLAESVFQRAGNWRNQEVHNGPFTSYELGHRGHSGGHLGPLLELLQFARRDS